MADTAFEKFDITAKPLPGDGYFKTPKVALSELPEVVATHAEKFESILEQLEKMSTGTGSTSAAAGASITNATKLTAEVQVKQSVLEMVQGVVKAATDHVKKQGQKVGQ